MVITEVRITLCNDAQNFFLRAYCSVTLDHLFAICDMKIIEGKRGLFVAMPSRLLTYPCPRCTYKNHLEANYCSFCGRRLDVVYATRNIGRRSELHADSVYPICIEGRQMIHKAVMDAYNEEIEKSKQPGYICDQQLGTKEALKHTASA